MNIEPWITVAGVLGLAAIGGLVWLIRLEGTVKGHHESKADATQLAALKVEVETLKQAARDHSDTRDIVIGLRADMKSLEKAMTGLADSMRDAVRELTAEVRDGRPAARRSQRAVS